MITEHVSIVPRELFSSLFFFWCKRMNALLMSLHYYLFIMFLYVCIVCIILNIVSCIFEINLCIILVLCYGINQYMVIKQWHFTFHLIHHKLEMVLYHLNVLEHNTVILHLDSHPAMFALPSYLRHYLKLVTARWRTIGNDAQYSYFMLVFNGLHYCNK